MGCAFMMVLVLTFTCSLSLIIPVVGLSVHWAKRTGETSRYLMTHAVLTVVITIVVAFLGFWWMGQADHGLSLRAWILIGASPAIGSVLGLGCYWDLWHRFLFEDKTDATEDDR